MVDEKIALKKRLRCAKCGHGLPVDEFVKEVIVFCRYCKNYANVIRGRV